MRKMLPFLAGLIVGAVLAAFALRWHERRCSEAAERAVSAWQRSVRIGQAGPTRSLDAESERKLQQQEQRQKPKEQRN